MILDALKKRLHRENDKAPGRCIKELPAVLQGLRTQPSRNMGVSPYILIYGAEAILLANVNFRSPKVEHFDQHSADESKELEINCIEEQ
jgi:hypothetical protein